MIDVKIDLSEVERARERLPGLVAGACRRAVGSACHVGARVAAAVAPHRTYFMKNHIDGRVVNVSARGATGEIVGTAFYTSFVNNGTSRIVARRFMERGETAAHVELDQATRENVAQVCATL